MQKVYYANCRLNGVTGLLAGPFLSVSDAERAMNLVAPIAVADRDDLTKASFGVMECNAPGAGVGTYNSYLPDDLIMALAVMANMETKEIIR